MFRRVESAASFNIQNRYATRDILDATLVTKSGKSQAPANPLALSDDPNLTGLTPDLSKDLLMNPGDRIDVPGRAYKLDMIAKHRVMRAYRIRHIQDVADLHALGLHVGGKHPVQHGTLKVLLATNDSERLPR